MDRAWLWRRERPLRPELPRRKLCDRFQNPTVVGRAKKGALFQRVHSLIPDRSLRAGVPSTEPESVCIPVVGTRSQGSLPSSGLSPRRFGVLVADRTMP